MTGAYAPLGQLSLYYEVHGSGTPLIMIPGGMLTIDLGFGALIPRLAADRQVIALEQQGHGRTGDIDRSMALANLAGDVVGLLDHLGLERADVLGFSLGGLTALETAVRYPARVDRLVVASAHTRADGYHDEIFDPARWATSTRMPTEADFAAMLEAYDRLAPAGTTFEGTNAKVQPVVTAEENWSAEELAGVAARTLVMIGDHDFVTVEHAERTRRLIPDARLAVVPGATHTELMHRVDVVAPILRDFLRR
jgi:pimeloyl-ACP methyl ester carboxylesterase